jgi:pilus assembly protein CpaE
MPIHPTLPSAVPAMQRVAIVDPSESSRESLRTLLLGVDFVWLEAECARYEYFGEVLHQNTPDLAIVALDSDKQRALATISQLSIEFPALPILTISSDHQALLQSLQKGAKYFLTHPVGLEDLLSALRRALGDSPAASSQSNSDLQLSGTMMPKTSQPSQIIAVLGSRGGIGTTTLAVNLAATLACESGNGVALLDLDLALGDADIAIEVDGIENFSIADLARNIERLDMNFLRRALARHADTGLNLLRHPLEITDITHVHEAHIERILNLLRISYSHLVLDLSKTLQPTDLMGLRMADKILLVAQLELSSLRNVVRLIHCLSADGALGDKIHVVVNRVGSENSEDGISLKKAEEVIGKPIFWQIPNDSKPVISARTAGQPLIKHQPKCRAQASIAGLAQALSGRPLSQLATPAGAPDRAKGWSLFGRK